MAESKDEKYTKLSIPLDKMSDQQLLMLGIIMQEGALRMQEMIVEKLKAEDSVCIDWAISVVESVDASSFAPVTEEKGE